MSENDLSSFCFSGSSMTIERSGLESSSTARHSTSSSCLILASLSPMRAERAALGIAFSTTCRSAIKSSVSMVSISRMGSTEPSTCTISLSSKHRTTCRIASTSLMFVRNLFPRPSPDDAPFTSPAISTSFRIAGMTFCVVILSFIV